MQGHHYTKLIQRVTAPIMSAVALAQQRRSAEQRMAPAGLQESGDNLKVGRQLSVWAVVGVYCVCHLRLS